MATPRSCAGCYAHVQPGQPATITVRAYDVAAADTLIGKQVERWYTQTGGIWQTVWLEGRPAATIEQIQIHADVRVGTASFTVSVASTATAMLTVRVPEPHAWSPEDPFLYDCTVHLEPLDGGETDSIGTYFGLRSISTGCWEDRPYQYVLLNGEPVYLRGALDQAFHPDGVYRYPSGDAIHADIQAAKDLGLNMLRCHIKINDPRYYYWADRLGMLIMYDIPNFDLYTPTARANWEGTLRAAIARDASHPSIIAWIIFNETWGLEEHDRPVSWARVALMVALTKMLDPTRPVEDNSTNKYDHFVTDLNSWHFYIDEYGRARRHIQHVVDQTFVSGRHSQAPEAVTYVQGTQPLLNSEYAGIGACSGDLDVSYSFKFLTTELRRHDKICGYVYTELTDVEWEHNGYLNYDRSPKEWGYDAFVPGMRLADLNGTDMVGLDCPPCQTLRPGSTFRAQRNCLPWSATPPAVETAIVIRERLDQTPMADTSADRKPNIVLILADDMGFSDLGCYGSEIATPNLNALAAGGLRLTQMYNGARCCPTRASLLTGLYAQQAGVGHMVNKLGDPAYQGYLNDHCVTIAEAFRPAGYRTLMAGKWHVGGQYGRDPQHWHAGETGYPTPLQRGFDHHYGTLAGAGSYFHPHTLQRDGEYVQPAGDDYYYTDAIGREAAAMIEQAAEDNLPFFCYVAYTAPHWPLHAFPEDIARYRGSYRQGWDAVRAARSARQRELGILPAEWTMSPRDAQSPNWESLSAERQDWEDARMATYAAQVARMDRSVGLVLAALRQSGVAQNTLVLFLSDNGGCAELLREDGRNESAPPLTRNGRPVRVGNVPGLLPGPADTYMSYDLPWANASNTPFRLYKHWVHEGGISTPLIASWPGVIPAGGISHSPCHLIDVLPTALAAAGVGHPATAGSVLPPEGESLLPLLQGNWGWQRERPLCWEHEGNRAVRHGHWKLVSKFPGDWELYDMARDRTEVHDLADEQPAVVQDLAAVYDTWASHCGVLPWDDIRPQRR